jgi:hypothetical protein
MASYGLATGTSSYAMRPGHDYQGQHISGNAKVHLGDVIYSKLQPESATNGLILTAH